MTDRIKAISRPHKHNWASASARNSGGIERELAAPQQGPRVCFITARCPRRHYSTASLVVVEDRWEVQSLCFVKIDRKVSSCLTQQQQLPRRLRRESRRGNRRSSLVIPSTPRWSRTLWRLWRYAELWKSFIFASIKVVILQKSYCRHS